MESGSSDKLLQTLMVKWGKRIVKEQIKVYGMQRMYKYSDAPVARLQFGQLIRVDSVPLCRAAYAPSARSAGPSGPQVWFWPPSGIAVMKRNTVNSHTAGSRRSWADVLQLLDEVIQQSNHGHPGGLMLPSF